MKKFESIRAWLEFGFAWAAEHLTSSDFGREDFIGSGCRGASHTWVEAPSYLRDKNEELKADNVNLCPYIEGVTVWEQSGDKRCRSAHHAWSLGKAWLLVWIPIGR